MAFALEKFLFCLELQLGGIIMAWWGMIVSAISIISIAIGLISNQGHPPTWLPFHFNTGSYVTSSIVALILCVVYFYFSYQLLLATQSVS
jgi:hypothetical protein